MDAESIRALAEDIYREKVLRARGMSFVDRFRVGGDLFDEMSAVSISGIRSQHPTADDATIRAMFSQRMRIARSFE